MATANRIPPFSLWTFSGSGVGSRECSLDTTEYQDSPDSAKLVCEAGLETPSYCESIDFPVVPGVEITLTFYAKKVVVSGDETLVGFVVKHKDAGGAFSATVSTKMSEDLTTDWAEYSATFTPDGQVDAIRIEGVEADGAAVVEFYVDTLDYPQTGDRTTTGLRDNLVSDLEWVKEYNGSSTTLERIYKHPPPVSEMRTPGVSVFSPSYGTSEVESTCSRVAMHTFAILAAIDSNDVDKIDNFLDDIRNAIERSDGNLNSNPLVQHSSVSEWSEPETDEDIQEGTFIRLAFVRVEYHYQDGAL